MTTDPAQASGTPDAEPPPEHFRAVAKLYQAWITGLLLFVATRKSAEAAGELSHRLFRRQHHEKFLSSFDKLGLTGLPHAVACARYHYLSNSVGGVPVEYVEEGPKKAWVRFRHPRWMYEGAALAGMPLAVSRGFLTGWYAQNGVSLKNPRLGFVVTSEDMDGQYGLAGYFREADHDLSPDERLVFAQGEMPPPVDPAALPGLDSNVWPEARLEKANRNYAMEYLRSSLPELVAMVGPMEAAYLAGGSAQIIGKQMYQATAEAFRIQAPGAAGAAQLLAALARASGDKVTIEPGGAHIAHLHQSTWRLMRGRGAIHPAVFDAWNGLLAGLVSMHDRFLVVEVLSRLDYGDDRFTWRIRRRSESSIG